MIHFSTSQRCSNAHKLLCRAAHLDSEYPSGFGLLGAVAQLMGVGGGGGGSLTVLRPLKTESYLGRGEAAMARATSSLRVRSETVEGRTLDCCILLEETVSRGVERVEGIL